MSSKLWVPFCDPMDAVSLLSAALDTWVAWTIGFM
eukprot:CAMPEP_0174752516 /NCGR_PEP_ID=MMETSP1094-20130205/102222_1 /TAXON_ID=156173 /ORGANISM="Chrysochromulina brevifilum, Strain UTEX LB 985" /LENGTH=34 /DNA_ID= /DNA_START= /DNA_END= /DNA_ORIENTATION=